MLVWTIAGLSFTLIQDGKQEGSLDQCIWSHRVGRTFTVYLNMVLIAGEDRTQRIELSRAHWPSEHTMKDATIYQFRLNARYLNRSSIVIGYMIGQPCSLSVHMMRHILDFVAEDIILSTKENVSFINLGYSTCRHQLV